MTGDDRPAVPEVIAFDADDTLWHNEIHYARAQQRLQALLAPYFHHVEVVSAKTEGVYRTLLRKHQISPRQFLMVGNSLRSDVLPVVTLGGYAVHIPYAITWQHEQASATPQDLAQPYAHLEHVGLLPGYVERLAAPHLG